MTNVLKSLVVRALGVSIAFTLGAVLIVIALPALAQFASADGLLAGVDSWTRADLQIVGYAAFAGLIVDAVRCIAAACWRSEPDVRLRLGKVMRQNLA